MIGSAVSQLWICVFLALPIVVVCLAREGIQKKWNAVESIGCFVCTSVNHSNPECEDTFNNTANAYVPNCWANRKGRNGLFPGTQCIKLTVQDEETGFFVIVRNCVVDNGGVSSETEIGRQSHCGWLREVEYSGKKMKGCLVSCNSNACNGAERTITSVVGWTTWTVVILVVGLQTLAGNRAM